MIEIKDGLEFLPEVCALFEEYKEFLQVDLTFQPIDETPQEVKVRYGGEGGRIFLAFVDGKPAGYLAFHAMEGEAACEFKRFFTRPEFRNQHVGSLLFETALRAAREMGYRAVYLDTLSTLPACNHMYQKAGFQKIPAYYHNPLPHVCYYRLDLTEKAS